MQIPIYQLDAFAQNLFEGNPAAVCPLDSWLSDETMQNIATENNLSETAFFVGSEGHYEIRWFTPNSEVDLCGHATLATAYVIHHFTGYAGDEIVFSSRSGELKVQRDTHGYCLDFPLQAPEPCELPEVIRQAFKQTPLACLKYDDYILVFEDEAQVRAASPNMQLLSQIDLRGVCITSQARDYDFISRFFAPKFGIDEDPVTGSSFTQLAPYWSQRLNKHALKARQVSQRGGDVGCEIKGNRVLISGEVRCFLNGHITLD